MPALARLARMQSPRFRPRLMQALLALAAFGTGLALAFNPVESILPLLIGLLVIILAIVALMPRPLTLSDRTSWVLLIAFVALFCLYPSYVPIRLPGLPWISPIRVCAALFLFAWLYLLLQSRVVMEALRARMRANRVIFIAFGIFWLSQVMSLPTAIDVDQALTRFSLFQLYWTFPFLAVITLLTSPERIRTLVILLILCAGIQSVLGFIEGYRERSLWATILPAGFGSDNEFLQRALQGTFRFDAYRVQNSFSVSLLYAEFLVLVLPFAVVMAIEGRGRWTRLVSGLIALAILPAQYLSGSRLGMVGILTVAGILASLFVIRLWLRNRRSLLVATLVVLVPVGAIATAGVFAASPRLQTYVLGGGQHEASNEGRREQIRAGIPLSMNRPVLGYGIGLGAEALGFRNLAGILTIDTYVMGVILEIGYPGSIAYLVLILAGIVLGGRLYLGAQSEAGRMGAAMAASLAAFLPIKFVLSQTDNHMLVFLFLGMLVQARRLDQQAGEAASATEPAPARSGLPRRASRRIPQRPGLSDRIRHGHQLSRR
jgi:hypothetical protein